MQQTQFTLVVQNINTEEFEKLLAIQSKSNQSVRWTPQQINLNNVSVGAMNSVIQNIAINGKTVPTQVHTNVRIDWDEKGAKYAREILDIFTPHQAQQVQAG